MQKMNTYVFLMENVFLIFLVRLLLRVSRIDSLYMASIEATH